MSKNEVGLSKVVETKQIPSYDEWIRADIDDDINVYLRAGWILVERWVTDRGLFVLLGWTDKDRDAVHPIRPSEKWLASLHAESCQKESHTDSSAGGS